MNAPPSVHPTDQTLSDYGLGKLDRPSAEAVNAHLEGCAACRRRTSEMTSDSFLGKFRDGRSAAGSLIGPGGPVPTQSFAGLDVHAPDALPPGLAGHSDYEVVSELGRGGMGVVYLANNTLMGRMEVLKVIGRSLTERPEVLDRFLREIRSVARLRHPNIVAAYHAFRIEAGLVFAMEHVDGFDLSKMVKARGPLPVAHACLFAHQAALGLQHAHEEGMVHRDIKPGNLMVSRRGEKAVVKILDFGLAKATSEGQLDSGLTHEGQMLGTPDFIAPEQIVNAQKADIRADIYSLGCTLYYLLSGGPPFRGVSLYDLFQAHHSIDAKLLNFVRPEVPTDLAALVAKMMAKEPERRFRTPADVAEALAPFTKKGGVTLKPTRTDVSRAGMPVVKRPAAPDPPIGPRTFPAARPAPEPPKPAEPEKPEARWSSLIDFRDPDSKAEKSIPKPAPAGPTRKPPWRSWKAVAAAALGGVVLLGIIITIKISKDRIEIAVQRSAPPAVPRATVDSGTWTIEGDELVQSNDEIDATMAFGDPAWSDYDLTLEAQKSRGSGHGYQVMFHRLAPKTFGWLGLGVFENKGCEMYFETDAVGSRASDDIEDNWAWKTIDVGDWYSIKIEVRKSHFTCYLDGHRIFEGSHRDHTHGRLALNTKRIQARFRKIKVTAPDGAVLFEGIPEIYSVGKVPAPTLAVKAPAAPLFNGKDLTGWMDVLPNNSEWMVVDGVLVGRGSGKPGGQGLLVLNRKDLKNYRLRARHRIGAGGWGGAIEIRRTSDGELASGYIASLCRWPKVAVATAGSLAVLERQRDGVARDGWFAALPTPIEIDEWFDVMVDVYGNTVVTWVNGKRVCEYTDPAGLHPSGAIALSCGPNATVQYQSITLEEWADTPGAAASVASVPAPAPTVRPTAPAVDAARRLWASNHMTFENFEPGRWREVNDFHRRIFYYRESGGTGRSVELFNPYRGQGGIWVRLGDARGEVKQGSRFGWSPLADGRWTSAPPAVARITTAEAVRRLEEDVRKFRDPAHVAARGDAFKEVADGLVADFERRVAALRSAGPVDASGLMAWTNAVRDSAVYREDPAEEARIQAAPGFVLRAREAQKQLGEASYDVESLRASGGTDAFVPLFNGKDLDGWQPAGAIDHRWSVVDGTLVSAAPEVWSRLDTKREDFKDVHLRLDTMLSEGVEGAVDVRYTAVGDTPGFYAATVAGTASQDSRTGSLQHWTTGKRSDVATASEVPIRPGEWFRLEMIAVDDTITVLVAGKEVARYKDPDHMHRSGSIGLFCRPGATMRFRNIEVKELPATAGPGVSTAAAPGPARAPVDRPPVPSAAAEPGAALQKGTEWSGFRRMASRDDPWSLKVLDRRGGRITGEIILGREGVRIYRFEGLIDQRNGLTFETEQKGSFHQKFEGEIRGREIVGAMSGKSAMNETMHGTAKLSKK
jgi:serine/threonine protein kinase